MNELLSMDFERLLGRLPYLRDVSVQELAATFGMSDETKRRLRQDRSDIWNRGFLPVVPGDYWDYVEQVSQPGEGVEPKFWINIRRIGPTSVLVPNDSKDTTGYWSVMIFDLELNVDRPVIFNVDDYQGTYQPALDCITDRGACRPNICNGVNHECRKFRGDDEQKGGKYFWCECVTT